MSGEPPITTDQDSKPQSHLEGLQERIKLALTPAALGADTVTKVVQDLANKEIDRRAAILAEGLTKQRAALGEFRKASKQETVYNADGSTALKPLDQTQWKAVQEAKKKLDRITNALNAVLEKQDADSYKKLEDANKGTKEGGDES